MGGTIAPRQKRLAMFASAVLTEVGFRDDTLRFECQLPAAVDAEHVRRGRMARPAPAAHHGALRWPRLVITWLELSSNEPITIVEAAGEAIGMGFACRGSCRIQSVLKNRAPRAEAPVPRAPWH